LNGVISTKVGYAGGTTINPTYRNMGDHTESLEIEYNPTVISYDEIVDFFWNSHNPTSEPWSKQYMSIAFYHSNLQKEVLLTLKKEQELKKGKKIYTELMEADMFYSAEDYHQKYYLQGVSELMKELLALYPNFNDFVKSTAAAKINGYVAGYGSIENLKLEIDSFGLSNKGQEHLTRLVKKLI